MNRAVFVLLLLFTVPAGATSPTLTLEAVFARPEAPWTPPSRWRTADPAGPPFEIPAREAFRVEPSPTPSPVTTPEPVSEVDVMEAQIGRISSRLEAGREVTQISSRPLLEETGRILSTGNRGAVVEIENEFRELCVRLVFEPEKEGDEPFVLLLAPETADQFDVPPGRYRFVREVWTANGEGLVREEFPIQPLEDNWRYRIALTPSEERRLIRQGGPNFL